MDVPKSLRVESGLADEKELAQKSDQLGERCTEQCLQLKEENILLQQQLDAARRQVVRLEKYSIPHHELCLEATFLGEGGFGQVFRGKWQGLVVAVKKMKAASIEQQLVDCFVAEARTMRQIRHKHTVQLLGTASERDDEDLMIVMEYMKDGSLHDLVLKHKIKLERHQVIQLALDVAKGLKFLHSRTPQIIHRDLTCGNILLHQNKSRAKISDFGTARLLDKKTLALSTLGTIGYLAPEIREEQPYDEKADVYSFGVVLFVMMTNKLLTTEESLAKVINSELADGDIKQLIVDCCATDPNNRPTIGTCIDKLKQLKSQRDAFEDQLVATIPYNKIVATIPYSEITFGNLIERGAYNEVFKAKWNGIIVAVKKATKQVLRPTREHLIQETQLLTRLHYTHIVQYYGATEDSNTGEVMLVMEYMKHGSLEDLLFKRCVKLERYQAIQLALDVAKGLNYLHCLTPKIIHGDLKPGNILLYTQEKSRAKISFRLGYLAPEMLEEEYDEKADVYSFGVVLLVLVTSNLNLPMTRDPIEPRNRIDKMLNASSMRQDTQFRELVHHCCQFDPAERPTMKYCVEVLKKLRKRYDGTVMNPNATL